MEEKKVQSHKGEIKPFWSREMTGVLKAIAILLMFVHHFFSFPSFHPDNVSYSWAQTFSEFFTAPTKICVGIFAFITGYMYFFSKKKDLKASFRSSKNLLVRYWIVSLPLLLLAIALGVYSFHVHSFFWEMLGVRNDVMKFAWYVYFYIFLMFFLPFLRRISKDQSAYILLFSIVILNFIFAPLYGLIPAEERTHTFRLVLSNCWLTSFPAVIGYVIARSDFFSRVKMRTDKIPAGLRYFLFFLLAIVAFMARKFFYSKIIYLKKIGPFKIGFGANGDILYVPVFIFCVVELLRFLEKTKLIRVFVILGKYSVYMWFWHCMFFGALGTYTKRMLYAPKIPILVFLWGVAICLCLSFLSDKIATALFSLGSRKKDPSSGSSSSKN